MPTWAYVLTGLATLLTGGVSAYVLLRKYPLEHRKLTVETVDVNVKIAGALRDDAMEDRQAAREELAALRAEFEQYRADTNKRLAELGTLLRAEKAENERLRSERDRAVALTEQIEREAAEEISRLQERVQVLEDEVRELRANGGPHAPT
jgi:chromosome segregation ATPase